MPKKLLSEETGTYRRNFFKIFILLFNTFTWYYATLLVLTENLPNGSHAVFQYRAVYYSIAFASGIAGALISEKMRRLKLLKFWIILGVAATLLPAFLGNITAMQTTLILSLLGLSFGLGMPSCLAYFANETISENRGYTGGVIYFTVNMSALPIAIFLTSFSFQINLAMLAVWRGLGAISFFLPKQEEKDTTQRKQSSFKSVFENKSFILYLLPWCMFALIDIFEKTIIKGFIELEQYQLTLLMQPILTAISALIGGILADRIGRKRVVIYGFVSLGIAYAIIGIAPQTILISWYFYFIIDAIATGMLWVTFILVLWGDLSQLSAGEKYYVIGSAPFLLTEIIPLTLTLLIPEVTTKEVIPAYTAFSVASFFLFLAVLPLMYAPETLPEKKIEIRRLKGYVQQAKKLTEKYTKKS